MKAIQIFITLQLFTPIGVVGYYFYHLLQTSQLAVTSQLVGCQDIIPQIIFPNIINDMPIIDGVLNEWIIEYDVDLPVE